MSSDIAWFPDYGHLMAGIFFQSCLKTFFYPIFSQLITSSQDFGLADPKQRLKGSEPQLVVPYQDQNVGNHNLWFPIKIKRFGTTYCDLQPFGLCIMPPHTDHCTLRYFDKVSEAIKAPWWWVMNRDMEIMTISLNNNSNKHVCRCSTGHVCGCWVILSMSAGARLSMSASAK